MVTPELLRFLFQYNSWADRRLLDTCSALSNEQFTRNLGSSFSSAGYPDLASIRAKLEEMDQYYIDYVSKLTQQDLDRVIRYKGFTGEEFSNPLWQSLHQLTNHASYHRGQVVTMLRQLGVKPVSTDLIGYYREQAAAARA
jgi:uncharacterized damage-inducible protein DinB